MIPWGAAWPMSLQGDIIPCGGKCCYETLQSHIRFWWNQLYWTNQCRFDDLHKIWPNDYKVNNEIDSVRKFKTQSTFLMAWQLLKHQIWITFCYSKINLNLNISITNQKYWKSCVKLLFIDVLWITLCSYFARHWIPNKFNRTGHGCVGVHGLLVFHTVKKSLNIKHDVFMSETTQIYEAVH